MTAQSTDSPSEAGARPAAVRFVFVVILLDMLSFGMLAPVLPQLMLGFENGDAAAVARDNGLLGLVWASMQFLFMPILGALSDRYGRRPVILIACFGLAISFMLHALAQSVAWLVVARMISGATAASFSTASAYIADVTPPERRAKAFGLVSAAFGLGFIIGPAVGGVLGGDIRIGDTLIFDGNPRLPFWVACGLCLLNALYGLFVLPESLPKDKRSPFRWRNANPVGAFRFLQQRPALGGFAWVQFLSFLVHAIYPSLFALYISTRFNWGSEGAGLALAMVGLSSIIVGAFLVQPTLNWLGERRALLLAMASWVAGLLVFGLAPTPVVFLSGLVIGAISGVGGPAISAIMTRLISPTEQGALQGSLGALRGLADMIGPVLFSTWAFSLGLSPAIGLPGLPWLLAAAIMSVAWVLVYSLTRPAGPTTDPVPPGAGTTQ